MNSFLSGKHFASEAFSFAYLNPFFWIGLLIFLGLREEYNQPLNSQGQLIKIPITLEDLLHAAVTGYWPNLSHRSPE